MFDIGLQEMLLIGVLALLVFGPSKLPELGRMFGRAMREFRRASDEFRSTVETNLHINDVDPIISPPTPAPETPAPVAEAASLPSEQEPVGAFEDADTPLAEEHGEPFLARRGARLVHRRQCSWVARIAEPDRVYFKRLAEGREQGLVTCPVCEPWESSS